MTIRAFCLSLVLVTCSKTAVGFEQGRDEVVRVLLERAEQIRTIEIDWIGTGFQVGSPDASPTSGTIPPKDVSYSTEGRLLCDPAGRVRYEIGDAKWSVETGDVVPIKTVLAFDRGRSQKLHTGGGFEYPRVFQGGKKESPTPGKHVRLLPIRLAFWPLDPLVGVLTKEDLVLTNEPAIVDGREHTVVRSRGGADAAEIWLDPERDFVPVRYSLLWDDAVVISVSLDYKSMDGHWVPQSWKITMLDSSGAIRRSYSESVTKCHVNGTLDDAEFSIRPEPGAWVTDSSNDEVYIVRQDGSKRIVGPTEYTGSNYRELLNSDPKDAEGGKFVLWAASAVAVAVFSFLLWIRQRRLRQLGRSRDN